MMKLSRSLVEQTVDSNLILETAKMAWQVFDSVEKYSKIAKKTFADMLEGIMDYKSFTYSAEILEILESTPSSPVNDFVYSIVAKKLLFTKHPLQPDSNLSKCLELVGKIESLEIRDSCIESLVGHLLSNEAFFLPDKYRMDAIELIKSVSSSKTQYGLLKRVAGSYTYKISENHLRSMMVIAEAFSEKKYYEKFLRYLIDWMTKSAFSRYSRHGLKSKWDEDVTAIKVFLDSQKPSTELDSAYLHLDKKLLLFNRSVKYFSVNNFHDSYDSIEPVQDQETNVRSFML